MLPFGEIGKGDRSLVGEKCWNLARLRRAGYPTPDTVSVTTEAYRHFVACTGLKERIQLELNRRDLDSMRWEELWDAGLRIRGMFLEKDLPSEMRGEILSSVTGCLGTGPYAVRSSAPGEDSSESSFAGLHESYINVAGGDALFEKLRLVWASLWSDAALLYRRELGLDLEESAMAVAVQRFVPGESSGVVFTASPSDSARLTIEAVHGLNEGLVDGTVEPHRWVVEKEHLRVVSHDAAAAEKHVRALGEGTELAELPPDLRAVPPLGDGQVGEVTRTALELERLFGGPQDVEFTLRDGELVLLQARPVTARAPGSGEDDARGWYLSLRRSLGNLEELRGKIEDELLPAMAAEGQRLAAEPVRDLANRELAAELRCRGELVRHWQEMYRLYFIPFAHGMRLFGQVYNSVMHPGDPYEFVDLLGGGSLESLERNAALEDLAAMVRRDAALAAAVAAGDEKGLSAAYRSGRARFIERYGDLSCRATGGVSCGGETRVLESLLLEMAKNPPAVPRRVGRGADRTAAFIVKHPDGPEPARRLLAIAEASYRLRDNDNIVLGRIEAGLTAALNEARRRLDNAEGDDGWEIAADLLEGKAHARRGYDGSAEPVSAREAGRRPRQLVGQPAGPGLGGGAARVVRGHIDLADFKRGEVLVCDAVDPNMTFVVPLASAIVERRGGMLIHGAIIAREYGLPCVTGIPDAVGVIDSGDELVVDGYLGIVTVTPAGEEGR